MLSAKEVAALAAKALDAKMGEDIRLIGITDISTPRRLFPHLHRHQFHPCQDSLRRS